MLAILLREVGYFVLLNLRPGNKVLNERKILSKLMLKFNSLDLDRLFVSFLKYLRKVWDLRCITCPKKNYTVSFVLKVDNQY